MTVFRVRLNKAPLGNHPTRLSTGHQSTWTAVSPRSCGLSCKLNQNLERYFARSYSIAEPFFDWGVCSLRDNPGSWRDNPGALGVQSSLVGCVLGGAVFSMHSTGAVLSLTQPFFNDYNYNAVCTQVRQKHSSLEFGT